MNNTKNNKGVALLLTILILTSVLAVVIASSSLIMRELKISKDEKNSTFAFYAAESGIERMLWDIRKNRANLNPSQLPIQFLNCLCNNCAYKDTNDTTGNSCDATGVGGYCECDNISCKYASTSPTCVAGDSNNLYNTDDNSENFVFTNGAYYDLNYNYDGTYYIITSTGVFNNAKRKLEIKWQ